MKVSASKVDLPKHIYFVLNPEGKAFNDSVSYSPDMCRTEFVKSWFSGWGIHPTGYESNTIFAMFERRGFKLLQVELPKNEANGND